MSDTPLHSMNPSPPAPSQISHGYVSPLSSRKMPASAKQSLINLSLGMGIMLAALSGGAYLMMTNKEVLLGGKASVDKQSSFSFAAPPEAKPGEQFTIDVMLDTSADPEYTISGADAVIQYSFTPEQQQTVGGGGGGSGGSGSAAPAQVLPFTIAEEPSVTGVVREVMDGSRLGLGAGGPNVGDRGISWEEQQSMNNRLRMYPMFTLVKVEQGSIFDSYPASSTQGGTPTPSMTPTPQIMCGGIRGLTCPDGMVCQYNSSRGGLDNQEKMPTVIADEMGVCASIPKPTYYPEPLPPTKVPSSQIMCGGIAGVSCPEDMFCYMTMRTPDASGYCLPNSTNIKGMDGAQVLGSTTLNSKKLAMTTEPSYGAVQVSPPAPPNPDFLPQNKVLQGTTSISGIKNYSVDDQGHFQGFTGKGVFARLTFIANTPGKIELKFAYSGATATDDSNINGFLKTVPVNIQQSSERLLSAPQSLQVLILNPKPSPTMTPTPTPVPPTPTPTPTMTPTPTPVPPTPTPTPTPITMCTSDTDCAKGYECYQPPMPACKEGTACIQMMPAPYCRLMQPFGTPNPSATPTPTPTSTPRPANKVSWRTGAVALDADDFEISVNRDGVVKKYHARSGNVTVYSDMNPQKPTLELSWTENDTPMRLYMYFTNFGTVWSVTEMRTDDGSANGEWVYFKNIGIKSLVDEVFISPKFSVTSSDRGSLQDGSTVSASIMFTNLRLQNLLKIKPTPTPLPDKPVMNVALSLQGRSNHTTRALVYQVTPNGESLLGSVQTDSNGYGSIQVSNTAIKVDPNLRLFVEVPGYLRKYHQSLGRSGTVTDVSTYFSSGTLLASFGMLTAGDIHIDASGFGDHQVNSVDIADMYTQWTSATEPGLVGETRSLSGDINGDGVVNNRDYVIVIMNFGKKAGVVR